MFIFAVSRVRVLNIVACIRVKISMAKFLDR